MVAMATTKIEQIWLKLAIIQSNLRIIDQNLVIMFYVTWGTSAVKYTLKRIANFAWLPWKPLKLWRFGKKEL